VGDGRAVGSEPQTARRPMRRTKALGRGNTTHREEVEEMNDEALHYAMIGGRPKEKQRAIEQHQQPGMPGCNGC